MTKTGAKYTCPNCGASVRRPGKHANHVHRDLRPTKFRRLMRKILAAKED